MNDCRDSRFKTNKPKVIHEDFDGEVVIIHFDTGRYYSLNQTGSFVWDCIDRGAAQHEIVDAIKGAWECDSTDIQATIEAFLSELIAEDLIVAFESPDGEGLEPPEVNGMSEPGTEKPAFVTPTIAGFNDMQELLLLDPIHDVDETGWPSAQKE